MAPDVEEAARNDLHDDLLAEVVSEARAQIPQGFILYDDNIFFEFISLPNERDGDDVALVESVNFHGILFDREELAENIARTSVARYDDNSVTIPNLDQLHFSVIDRANTRPTEDESIRFTLSGKPQIVWTYDKERLKADLAGKSKRQISIVLSAYPGIEKAEVVIRPFWKQSFPERLGKISIASVVAVVDTAE